MMTSHTISVNSNCILFLFAIDGKRALMPVAVALPREIFPRSGDSGQAVIGFLI